MDFGQELADYTPEKWLRNEETCSERLADENFWNSVSSTTLSYKAFLFLFIILPDSTYKCN